MTGTTPCFPLDDFVPFAFSPEGSMLVGRVSQSIQFLDILSGQRAATLEASGNILAAALSPDGNSLAWSLDDNSAQLVELPGGRIRATLLAHPDPVFDLQFSPDGAVLFSASHDGTVRVWDASNSTALPSFEVGVEVLGLGVSPD